MAHSISCSLSCSKQKPKQHGSHMKGQAWYIILFIRLIGRKNLEHRAYGQGNMSVPRWLLLILVPVC